MDKYTNIPAIDNFFPYFYDELQNTIDHNKEH